MKVNIESPLQLAELFGSVDILKEELYKAGEEFKANVDSFKGVRHRIFKVYDFKDGLKIVVFYAAQPFGSEGQIAVSIDLERSYVTDDLNAISDQLEYYKKEATYLKGL